MILHPVHAAKALTLLAVIAFAQAPSLQTVDAFAGTGELASHPGWVKQGGGGSLALDGAGHLVGRGESNGCAYLQSTPAPGSGAYTVSVTLSQHTPSDSGGPIAAAGPLGYVTVYPRNGSMVVVEASSLGFREMGTAGGWSQTGDDQVSIDVDPAAGTATFRVNDGRYVSYVLHTSLAGQRGVGIYNYHFSDAYSSPAKYSSFGVSFAATDAHPGIVHTTAYCLDVRAGSPVEAIATATAALPASGTNPIMRLDMEGYEAANSLPADGIYPSLTSVGATWSANPSATIDLPRQAGYQPDALPVATIGPRTASGVIRVWVVDREAVPTPDLATAQSWAANYYAPFLTLGRSLAPDEYLTSLPWDAAAANASASLPFAIGGTSVAIVPLRWAAYRASAVGLPRVITVTRPMLSIPIDPAIVSPEGPATPLPYQSTPPL